MDPAIRRDVERWAAEGVPLPEVDTLARRLATGSGDERDQIRLAAAFLHAAFAAPERIAATYDRAATAWFAEPVAGPHIDLDPGPSAPLGPLFWTAFWALVEESSSMGSGDVTSRTAALAAHLDPGLQARTAAACGAYPGVAEAARAGFPARTQLADLAACPRGSLGEVFHRLIVDNDFDLEVLDRDALGLARLQPPLDYLNARMLQTHDLWHILAGYRTTKLHEVAISAFQMAQFGHAYSAMFLAVITMALAPSGPTAFSIIMKTTLSAWMHGRRTPAMLLIPWEAVWTETITEVRARYGVSPYATPYVADLFEQLESGVSRREIA